MLVLLFCKIIMITNEDLTETEKLYKGIEAIVDVATLGYSFDARKVAEGGEVSSVRLLGVLP